MSAEDWIGGEDPDWDDWEGSYENGYNDRDNDYTGNYKKPIKCKYCGKNNGLSWINTNNGWRLFDNHIMEVHKCRKNIKRKGVGLKLI